MITIFLHLCLTGNTYQVNESLCKGFFFFLTVIYILLFSGRSTSVHFFKKITRLNVCSSSLLPPPWGKSFPIPAMTVLTQGSSLWFFHLTKLRFWANNSPEASGPWSQCSAKSLKAPGCTGFLYLEKEYARSRWSLRSLDRMERVGEACTWIRPPLPWPFTSTPSLPNKGGARESRWTETALLLLNPANRGFSLGLCDCCWYHSRVNNDAFHHAGRAF